MAKHSAAAQARPPKLVMRTEQDFELCALRLKALADVDRLKIVGCLFCGPKNVSQLAAELGEELVKVSHHLGVLRHAGMVQTEKQGKFVVYRLDPRIADLGQNDRGKNTSHARMLDLGCCRLELPYPSAMP